MLTTIAGLGFSLPFVCVSAFPHDISKIDAARITKLGTQMFHDESQKSIYCWGQKVKVTSHKNTACMGLCTLASAGFFWLQLNKVS